MFIEWLKRRLFEEDLSSIFLDALLEELATATRLDRRRVLWAEVSRRFVQDVHRACRIAGRVPETADDILDSALRGVGSEPPRYFSRDLVRLMRVTLGSDAVGRVRGSLYLRQFVTEVPANRIRYLNSFLDNEMELAWTAEALNEAEDLVRRRVQDAWSHLLTAIEREYAEDEIVERTDGVWDYFTLKN